MNKSYISVWNDASGTWVAAPETAKTHCGSGVTASSCSVSSNADSGPATPLKAMFMPIAMAIGAAMMPSMTFAQAVTGNGGLELCPAGIGGMGSSWGPLSSAVGAMSCGDTTGDQSGNGFSFSLNNGAATNGAWGYADGAITARVTGFDDGRLQLLGMGGIQMLNTVTMTGHKITSLAAGDYSLSSADAVNGAQLYQYTRYFQANSPSADPSTSAQAKGANSVASGPSSMAVGSNSSAYGANAVALVSNSVALGANSVASRNDTVSVGYLSADGSSQYTRQITNVTAGAAGTDAVNVNQLNAAIASVNGGGGGGGAVANAVVYDSSASTLITLKGSGGTKITNLTAGDISSGWSTDAVNGSQLYQTNQNVANVAGNLANLSGNVANVTNVVNNIVNNGIAGNPLVVTYDTTSRNTVTLGGVGATKAVKLTNVAAGDISTVSSTDAVNGGQLYTTNQNLEDLANNVGNIATFINTNGIKYFHTNTSLADSSAVGANSVAIGGQAIANGINSVALGSNSLADRSNAVSVGAAGSERQIINVAAGTANTDAVNLAQMNAAIATASTGGSGSPDAVIYDSSAHDKLTLGGRTSTVPVGLTNLAAGQVASSSKDAVNGSQLFNTASSVANALGGGSSVSASGAVTNPTYTLQGGTFNDVGSALSGLDTEISGLSTDVANTSKYVKVVSASSAAIATGSEAVALGGGAYASGTNSIAIGSGSRSMFANSVALGANSRVNAANTVSIGDIGTERRITNVANGVSGTDAATIAQLSALQTSVNQQIAALPSGSKSMLMGASMLGATPVTAYISVSSNVTAGTNTSTDNSQDAMAIGPTAMALGQGSLAVGAGAGTALAGSTAVGNGAAALALNTTVIGAGANTSNNATNAVAIGYNAAAQGANALSLGSSAVSNGSGSIAMGANAFVTTTASNALALGAGATVSQANTVALGANSVGDRANAISVGSSTAQRQITYVANGTNSTDAVNVSQLTGVTNLIGGGAGVNADGTIKKPAFTIGGQTYSDVGSAIAAAVSGGSANAVQYDTSSHTKVTLGGTGTTVPVTLTNVANGVANSDAVNVAQLQAMGGTINSSGVVTNAFVAYDDTTKNTVTLKGASGSTKITGLTAGALSATSLDAVNGTQLYQTNANVANVAGTVANVTNTVNNITNGGGIKYFHANSTLADSSAGGTNSVAIGGAANASANNSVALGSNSVANRANAVSVGAVGSERQIINVANGTNGTDAVNVSQLQAMGANITSGVVTNAFVAYDDSTKGKVTFGGTGATKAVTLTNVANGVASSDAVNVAQLQAMGGTINSSGVVTNAFVAYDDTTKNTITLQGASGSTKITGLTAGALSATSLDAVNGTQLYQTNANVANVAGTVANVTNTVNNITNGGGIKYFHANSTLADSSAGGTNSVAIGGAANASANNSVALGSNSVANRANAVSVGAVGSERQIINVANGTNGTDAVNVSQLQAMGANITSGVVTNAFVAYDDSTKGKVTFGGTGATKAVTLTNVANGVASSDAVNVAQLQAMGGTINSSGVVTNAFVAYDDTTKNTITLQGASGSTKITGLTAGALSATSLDAVNGTQLYQTNANVANVAGTVANVTNTVNNITNGGGIKYFHANSTLADSSAGGTNSVAIGGAANASANNSVALGSNSVANRANAVSVGAVGSERQIINVANGTNGTDAVNVSQLQAMGANITSGVVTNAFVAYDDSTKGKVTFGGTGATKAVTLTNVANGVASSDAVNVAQLQAMGGTINSSGVVTNAFVAYDDTTKNTITLKGASGTTKITALTAGALSATSSDAVNGSQLYRTATSVANALGGGSSMGLNGTVSAPSYQLSGGTYSDVGSALSGLDGEISSINNNIADTTKYIKVVSNSSAAIATGGEAVAIGGGAYASGLNSLSLGSGARSQFANSVALGANSRVTVANTISVGDVGTERRIMNVANGVLSSDAATLGQLNALQNSLTQKVSAESSGVKSMLLGAVPVTNYIAVSTTITPGLPATTTDNTENAMAIGPGAMAQGAGSVVVGAGSGSFHAGSTVIGSSAVAGAVNATVIGGGATTNNSADNSVVIGYMAAAQGTNALALGSNSVTNATNSVGLGANAVVTTTGTNSMALGSASTVSGVNAVAIGYNSTADRANTVSVGASGSTRQIVNVAAGSQDTDAVNLGQMNTAINAIAGGGAPNAVVYDTSAHTALTLNKGAGAVTVSNVADGVANNDAVNVEQLKAMGATIGTSGAVTNAFVAYDSTTKSKITLGGTSSTVPVALTNVAAGQITSSSKDAINGSQLYNVASSTAAALGGGSTMGSDGKISTPSYTLNGKTYTDVGAALVAAASGGSPDAVVYDTSAHTALTLNKGAGAVTVSNVADGSANHDAVNVEQLKAMGAAIGTSGVVTNSFVAYDDTNKGTVTFGGVSATTPVILANVGNGQVTSTSKQAINGSQLYGASSSVAAALGGASSVGSDGKVTASFKLDGSTYTSVGATLDALNSKIGTGSTDGVVYDTPAHDKLTLGGANATTPVTIANVAAATSDDQAVNLKQLKEAGLNVDTSGNVTSSFIAYDNASKNTVTFGGVGSTTPVLLKNVAAGIADSDAVNVGQMHSYVDQQIGGGTANGVAYDDSTKSKVTLGGVGSTTPVTLTNVAAGKAATDAVNYGQFSALENVVANIQPGTGNSTYININPTSGGTAAVATGSDSIAIGNGASASGESAIAIGKNTVTSGDNSVAMGAGASAPNTNAVALGANSTTDRDNSVSVGSAGAERQITNVAAGTQGTDAVNLNQLNSAMGNMSNSINNVDRSAAKGIASASALNIVTPYLPGRTTLNAGVANYRGYQAIGLGVSRWNEKGTINYNLGVSTSGGNSTIVRAGIGIVLGN